jgi:hypothetical protein
MLSGFATFAPKFIEAQFSLPASTAAQYVGECVWIYFSPEQKSYMFSFCPNSFHSEWILDVWPQVYLDSVWHTRVDHRTVRGRVFVTCQYTYRPVWYPICNKPLSVHTCQWSHFRRDCPAFEAVFCRPSFTN